MAVIVDHLDLVDTEPDPPRNTTQPVSASRTTKDIAPAAMAALRQTARRHARVWAD